MLCFNAWPLTRRFVLPLATFDGFRVEGQSRFQLVATTKDQPPVPASYRVASNGTLIQAAERLNAWVHAELDRPVDEP